MTAGDKRKEFTKTYLKPVLKNYGYKVIANTWFKDHGDFFTVINLQNFSWNTEHDITFCFNTGITFKAVLAKSNAAYPNMHNSSIYIRSGFYLPQNRQEHAFQNKSGYLLTDKTNLSDFINEFKLDFETYILPFLDKLNTVNDCIDQFGGIPFWGENLKRVVSENNL